MASEDQPNGLRLLTDWANEQDHWVRAIASEVIATRKELSDNSVDAGYSMLLAEKGLSQDSPPSIPNISISTAPAEQNDALRVVRIANVTGVNALATDQEISLNPCLTLMFGENAAGKTGYVRILKRIASVRSAQPILGNIRLSKNEKPGADIAYSLGSLSKTLDWRDEAGVPPFTRMSIFDSNAVAIHVDEDLTYVFTPSELALFLHVHRAIDSVKSRLERARDEAAAKATSPFLHRFQRDNVVYPKIETVGPSTSLQELESLAALSAEEEAALATIRDKVEALRPQSVENRLQVAISDRDLFTGIVKVAESVKVFSWSSYIAAVEEVRKATEQHSNVTRTAFSAVDVPGIFGEQWNNFINAADEYQRAVGALHRPNEGDSCPYCRQTLSKVALALVQKYHDFSNNESKKKLDAANETAEINCTIQAVACSQDKGKL